jgi:hypothetical protein
MTGERRMNSYMIIQDSVSVKGQKTKRLNIKKEKKISKNCFQNEKKAGYILISIFSKIEIQTSFGGWWV